MVFESNNEGNFPINTPKYQGASGASDATDEVDETDATDEVDETDATDETDEVDETDEIEGSDGSDETDDGGYSVKGTYKTFNEEKAFPDFIASAIQNEEQEKIVRELFEKADGLDLVKRSREEFKERVKHYEQELTGLRALQNDVKRAGHFLRNNDIGSFLSEYNLSEEAVLEHLIRKRELAQQNPLAYNSFIENQNRVRAEWENRQRYEMQQQELERYRLQNNQIIAQQRDYEIQTEMAKVADVVEAYDRALGKGAFRQAVLDRGLVQWHTMGKDTPPQELVEFIARTAGFTGQVNNRSGATQKGQGTQATIPNQNTNARKRDVKTLPNLKGGASTSPVRKLPRSIDDLRKIARNLN